TSASAVTTISTIADEDLHIILGCFRANRHWTQAHTDYLRTFSQIKFDNISLEELLGDVQNLVLKVCTICNVVLFKETIKVITPTDSFAKQVSENKLNYIYDTCSREKRTLLEVASGRGNIALLPFLLSQHTWTHHQLMGACLKGIAGSLSLEGCQLLMDHFNPVSDKDRKTILHQALDCNQFDLFRKFLALFRHNLTIELINEMKEEREAHIRSLEAKKDNSVLFESKVEINTLISRKDEQLGYLMACTWDIHQNEEVCKNFLIYPGKMSEEFIKNSSVLEFLRTHDTLRQTILDEIKSMQVRVSDGTAKISVHWEQFYIQAIKALEGLQ
ncbi:MAG: hypothetical protein ACRDF4_02420, partial [Rhabdochlamydiaceae bacterium]